MRPNTAKGRLNAGESVVCGWLSLPSSYSAELVASQGYDCVNIDLQHAMLEFETAVGMLQAISSTPAIPLARVGGPEPEPMMKLLDAGAYGIICPMISTVEDAEAFVSACRYPPTGTRSFGPARGLLYGGSDYVDHADAEILTIGMIETRTGVDNAEAIAAVDGLDVLFIGPNDLSMAYGQAPSSEPSDPEIIGAINHCLQAATASGKPCGIFSTDGKAAAKRRSEGFRFLVPGSDAGLLGRSTRDAVALSRTG